MPNYTKRRNRINRRSRRGGVKNNKGPYNTGVSFYTNRPTGPSISITEKLSNAIKRLTPSFITRGQFPLSANDIRLISEAKKRKQNHAITRRGTRSGTKWPIKYYTARNKYYYPNGVSSVFKTTIRKARR